MEIRNLGKKKIYWRLRSDFHNYKMFSYLKIVKSSTYTL